MGAPTSSPVAGGGPVRQRGVRQPSKLAREASVIGRTEGASGAFLALAERVGGPRYRVPGAVETGPSSPRTVGDVLESSQLLAGRPSSPGGRAQAPYTPQPLNVDDVELPESVEVVVAMLAKNSHDVWARSQLDSGVTYAPRPIEGKVTNASLVPWEHLQPKEARPRRDMALSFCKALYKLGFAIHLRAGVTAPEQLRSSFIRQHTSGGGRHYPSPDRATGTPSSKTGHLTLTPLAVSTKVADPEQRKRLHELRWFKQGLLNAYYFSVARCAPPPSSSLVSHLIQFLSLAPLLQLLLLLLLLPMLLLWLALWWRRVGNHGMLKVLLAVGQSAQVNCVDHKLRSALYLAVQFNHADTVRALVQYGCSVESKDSNGISPLTVAAFNGNLDMCELLLALGADSVSFVSDPPAPPLSCNRPRVTVVPCVRGRTSWAPLPCTTRHCVATLRCVTC